MTTVSYPGVYIEEVSSGVHTITGVRRRNRATGFAVFVLMIGIVVHGAFPKRHSQAREAPTLSLGGDKASFRVSPREIEGLAVRFE